VRSRLADEFAWVSSEGSPEISSTYLEDSPDEEKGQDIGQPLESAVDTSDPGQDLSLIVGNLAKSVISLAQQQSILLKRLDGIEAKMESTLQNATALDGQKLSGPADRSESTPAPTEADADLAGKLAGIERTLEQTMGLLGNYVEAVQDLVQTPVTPEKFSSGPPQNSSREMPEEYLRHLAALPLVYRNEHNDLMHLGDRSRGSYTLNDLKAVFAQACQPPDHYNAYWHVEKGQSWLVLEQPESQQPRNIFVLIKLVRVDRGAELAHIAELIVDSVKQPPMTLYPIIQQLLG
jgi:hypothetical protein